MTTVRFRIDGATAIVATPLRRFVDDDGVTLPDSVTYPLTGDDLVTLEPSTTQWCWVLREVGPAGITRYVSVPDSVTTLLYEELSDLDVSTFDPSADGGVAAWDATLAAVQAAATDAAAAAASTALALAPTGVINPLTGVYYAKLFGAKGDAGATISAAANAAAIQSAIDAAAAAGGGTVQMHPGNYRVTSLTMKPNVTLKSSAGFYSYDNPAVMISSTTPGAVVIDTPAGDTRGVAIEGITVDGGGVASIGVRFNLTYFSSIKRCKVNQVVDQGVQWLAGGVNVMEDVLILNSLLNRTRSAAAGAVEVGGTDSHITRVEANSSQTAASPGAGKTSGFLVTGSGNFFTDCLGEFCDYGYTISSRHNVFSNCRADVSWYHGWQVLTGAQSGWNLFSSCSALNCCRDAANTYSGWYITAVGNSFSACSTIVRNFPGSGGKAYLDSSPKYAFQDESSPATTQQRNAYSGCGGDFYTAMFRTSGNDGYFPWASFGTQTFTTSGTYVPPAGASMLRIEACAGGAGGGGGGSASAVTTQVGGGGGAASVPLVAVVPAVTLTIAINPPAAGGAGGASGGNAGSPGASGAGVTITGSGVSITPPFPNGGAGGGANSTAQVGGGFYGYATTTLLQGLGNGGSGVNTIGQAGGGNTGIGGGGGSGGAPSSASFGGVAGNAGTQNKGGVNAIGVTASTTGGTPADATVPGAGGAGGGGGAVGGAGGTGGKGGPALVIISVLS